MFHRTICTKDGACFWHKGPNCFGLELPEVKVGHALSIVLEHGVAIFGASYECTYVSSEVVYHWAQLLKLLQRDDRHHSALVEPHLFESSE